MDKTSEMEEEDDMIAFNEKMNIDKSQYILFPDSNYRFIWDLFSFIFILYQAIVLPYKLSFEIEIPHWMIDMDTA